MKVKILSDNFLLIALTFVIGEVFLSFALSTLIGSTQGLSILGAAMTSLYALVFRVITVQLLIEVGLVIIAAYLFRHGAGVPRGISLVLASSMSVVLSYVLVARRTSGLAFLFTVNFGTNLRVGYGLIVAVSSMIVALLLLRAWK